MIPLFRVLGAILLAMVSVPVYRLLRARETGLMGADVLLVADQDRQIMLAGAPIVLVLGIILARAAGPERIEIAAAKMGRMLTALSSVRFAAVLGLVATAYAAAFSLWILDGKPNLIDSMTQLMHARFVAAGHLSGPVDGWNEFWHMQNSLVTARGWVSHFPPGHVLLLGGGFALGAAWAVGPILCGVAAFFTAMAAEKLLPDDRPVARLGAVLAALSPFFIAHAGAYMNHVSAAAFGAAAVYFGVRARDDAHYAWPLLAGAATGAALTVRPLAAVVTAAIVAVIFASPPRRSDAALRRWLRASLVASVGALPFLAGLAAYNARFFGGPFRFGYPAAWGPASGLGFHRDPWGNAYGIVEAVGFTSSDLTSLSLHLLGTPIPAVLVAGSFLLMARRLTSGEKIIAMWALLPVVANFFYWHHGMFMGPRMLNESAPAWALLTAIAAVGLVRRIPRQWTFREYSARAALASALSVAGLAGILYLGPDRLRQYGGTWMASTRMEVPSLSRPALLFVHGGWTSRIAMRLAAAGLRLDSLETALRLNSTCDVHRFAARYPSVPATHAGLNFTPRSGELRPRIETARGNFIRMRQGERLSAECLREIASDTRGVVDIAPLEWQGDIAGQRARSAWVVRDMGPDENARIIAANPEREPLMLMRNSDDDAPTLLPYAQAIAILWSVQAAEQTSAAESQ